MRFAGLAVAGKSIEQLHIVTCEFPPHPGGVSDYTFLLAEDLSKAGVAVNVWCPQSPDADAVPCAASVHQELGRMSPMNIIRINRKFRTFPTRNRLLLQWVPHGYGFKSMNVWFCLWILYRATYHRDRIELMVHEPFLSFDRRNLRQSAVAFIHRIMITTLLASSSRVWLATTSWRHRLQRYCFRQVEFSPLPIPSNIPFRFDSTAVNLLRSRYGSPQGLLIGHFGTCGRLISNLLRQIIQPLLKGCSAHKFLLIGNGSEKFLKELLAVHPDLSDRLSATGKLDPALTSHHLQACDIMIQPYPDGITTRRGTAMAGLSHGLPIVTTSGHLTEPIWKDSNSVLLEPVDHLDRFVARTLGLMNDESERKRLGQAAGHLYKTMFDLSHTTNAILASRTLA